MSGCIAPHISLSTTWSKWQVSSPSHLTPGERATGICRVPGWVGPWANMCALEKIPLAPVWEWIMIPQASGPYSSHYTNCPIQALVSYMQQNNTYTTDITIERKMLQSRIRYLSCKTVSQYIVSEECGCLQQNKISKSNCIKYCQEH